MRMHQSLVPVLLMATAALSSSDMLPLLLSQQGEPLAAPPRDRLGTRHTSHTLLYKVPIAYHNRPKYKTKYLDLDNNWAEGNLNDIDKEDNYNGEGFRQEQWHNYPRQLDRLQQYLYNFQEKRNAELNPDLPGTSAERKARNTISNEFLLNPEAGTHNLYDTIVTSSNPLLILKIQLACLSKDIISRDLEKLSHESNARPASSSTEIENVQEHNYDLTNDINPEMNIMKVKRENSAELQNPDVVESTGNTKKSKRLFSLWSRLQSMSPNPHELQHRRHLHAFYAHPDSDSARVLTAETRALLRPPGSPLRWG